MLQHDFRAASLAGILVVALGAPFSAGNVLVLSVPQAVGGPPSIIEFQNGTSSVIVQTINIGSGVGDLQALVNGGKLRRSADSCECLV
jgi:hypothetical protein